MHSLNSKYVNQPKELGYWDMARGLGGVRSLETEGESPRRARMQTRIVGKQTQRELETSSGTILQYPGPDRGHFAQRVYRRRLGEEQISHAVGWRRWQRQNFMC